MTIWITELLKSAGINSESIKWGATAGDDEIDIIVDIHGAKAFFELKDREFGVGDAYPFLYRVDRYGGSFGVVVSTARIADEVKKIFQERQPGIGSVPIETVEGVESIRGELPRLIDRFSQRTVLSLVSEVTELIGVNLAPIVQLWMNSLAGSKES